jgi:alkylation response protein AidB-like acyl-CoA dehydrogenase
MYVLESCRNGGSNFSVSTYGVSVGIPVQRVGSVDPKKRYMPQLCDSASIGTHVITELDAGSDSMSMGIATPGEKPFIVNEKKAFISGGSVVDLFLVCARAGANRGCQGITTLAAEWDTPGLIVRNPVEEMALKASAFSDLTFDGYNVSQKKVIGKSGSRFFILVHINTGGPLCFCDSRRKDAIPP